MYKHSLLVIDDDPFILKTIQERFSDWDMELLVASNPVEAKQILERRVPELVLLDLLLTKDDGAEGIIDYIKSQPSLQHVPIIILTNLDKPELKQLLLSQGVKEYIIKGSLSLDQLYEKIRGYLDPQGTDNR